MPEGITFFQKNHMSIGAKKLLRMDLVPARGETSRWHPAHREAEVEKADGSSSQERVGVDMAIHGGG